MGNPDGTGAVAAPADGAAAEQAAQAAAAARAAAEQAAQAAAAGKAAQAAATEQAAQAAATGQAAQAAATQQAAQAAAARQAAEAAAQQAVEAAGQGGGPVGLGTVLKGAMAGLEGQSEGVKAAVGVAVANQIPPPPAPVVGTLWKVLVWSLSVILVIALGGIIYTVADGKTSTSPDVLVTVFTAALTGLIGLFVKTPS